MTLLGLVLGGLGLVDLLRPERLRPDARSAFAVVVPGLLAWGVLRLGGVGPWISAGTAVGVTSAGLVWALLAARALRHERAVRPALIGGAVMLSCAVLASAYSPTLGGRFAGWYSELGVDLFHGVTADRFVSVVGCALLLLSSGNVIVRLVLTAAGSSVARNEQQIKGGRFLGPMERLLIFGLGLSGNLGAAAVIVAAKGLLRFPELQSYRADVGTRETADLRGQRIDALTEYFLIGSMASWMVALACLALA